MRDDSARSSFVERSARSELRTSGVVVELSQLIRNSSELDPRDSQFQLAEQYKRGSVPMENPRKQIMRRGASLHSKTLHARNVLVKDRSQICEDDETCVDSTLITGSITQGCVTAGIEDISAAKPEKSTSLISKGEF